MVNASAPAICARGLTKDYGRGRGVFDVNLEVAAGEVLGFLGPNGAGKTVTMRHLMGFIKPQKGTVEILGHDCFRERPRVQARLGYLPGENVCMKEMTARSFLDLMAGMRGLRDRSRMRELVDVFDLDLGARIGGMSKGNRQKVAIVAAFMARPDVLLLDEPTSGLDPLMQERFLDLVEEERTRGVAILLSSHIFEEVGRACERVAFIRAGRVAMTCTMDEVRSMRGRGYTIEFSSARERARWELSHGNEPAKGSIRAVELRDVRDVNALIRELSSYDVASVTSREQTLEELFLHLYEGDEPSGQR
ncbi:ABC transporter ATP-binding protein [Enorma massiliensis]|uniref:ABC transporter ATP-binding protein n=1 Tax=Enorma massiliensis TaxID=1472761 RepID=UPI002E7871AD|nr:ABC transporter ATP-binding protein [Enorma massiliensis]